MELHARGEVRHHARDRRRAHPGAPGPAGAATGYAATATGGVWRTKDNGTTWAEITPPELPEWTQIATIDSVTTPDEQVIDEAFFRKYKTMPEPTKKQIRKILDQNA